jgi:hypothetical protein
MGTVIAEPRAWALAGAAVLVLGAVPVVAASSTRRQKGFAIFLATMVVLFVGGLIVQSYWQDMLSGLFDDAYFKMEAKLRFRSEFVRWVCIDSVIAATVVSLIASFRGVLLAQICAPMLVPFLAWVMAIVLGGGYPLGIIGERRERPKATLTT